MADHLRLKALAKDLDDQFRQVDADHLRDLMAQNLRHKLALACIRKSVDKLADAVRRGVYDSRSTVGDEVLNMLQEFEDLER